MDGGLPVLATPTEFGGYQQVDSGRGATESQPPSSARGSRLWMLQSCLSGIDPVPEDGPAAFEVADADTGTHVMIIRPRWARRTARW